ncbi:MAG TPA: PucR family transcriptional regulator, partial [Microbacterium sp.]|nr:PucR family transcriptional regulator [Microbacterium sp.]
RLRTELVSRAIEGGAEARDALERLGLSGQRVCVAAATLAPVPEGETRSDQDVIADRERLADALALNLSAVQRGAAVALVVDTVYGILPTADAAAEERAAHLAEDFLQRVDTRLPALIGIGQPAESVAEISRSRVQARRVLRVLSEHPGRRRVARLAEVETESLLLELRDLRASRGDISSTELTRLIEYDTRNDSQLVVTLAAWLDSFGDVKSAAAASFVHPNTFRYRLRRVIEVSGINLDDPDQRFAAMLELRTRRI